MAEKKYNIIKAASWYTIGNILIKGINFFMLPIFTRLMSTHEYGVYSIYIAYLTIFETIILLGLSSTVAIAKYAKEIDFESYMSTVLAIPITLSIIVMAVVNMIIPFWGDILSMNSILWNCLLITSMTGAVCNIIGARLVIDGRYMRYLGYLGIHTIGNVALSLAFCATIYKTENVHLARVYGSTLSAIISMLYLQVSTKTAIHFQKENIRYALAWGIPLFFHTVATVILTQSDRILIRYFGAYSSAGIYAVATTIITIPMVLQQSLQQAWIPWFYGKLDKKAYQDILWLNDRYIALFTFIIGGFMLVSPDLVHIFTGQNYWPCIYSLIPLALSGFIDLMYSIPIRVEYYTKNTVYVTTATLITVILNIILDVLFIRLFGYHGAAYATALSKIILFLMHFRFAKKLDPHPMFHGRVLLISFLFLAGLNLLLVTSINILWIRLILLIILILFGGGYLIGNKEILLKEIRNNTKQ